MNKESEEKQTQLSVAILWVAKMVVVVLAVVVGVPLLGVLLLMGIALALDVSESLGTIPTVVVGALALISIVVSLRLLFDSDSPFRSNLQERHERAVQRRREIERSGRFMLKSTGFLFVSTSPLFFICSLAGSTTPVEYIGAMIVPVLYCYLGIWAIDSSKE